MKIQLLKRFMVHDKNGILVKDTGKTPSHSYVIQFLELLEGWLFYTNPKNATDVDNAESVIVEHENVNKFGRVDAPINDDTYGIVVGTNDGSTAEGNTNYVLDTKILHGVETASKLNHQAVVRSAPAVDGANVDYDVSRPFVNDSGGTITVKEIGIICKNTNDTKYHLLLRDVVSDFAVEDGYTLTVVYTLRTTA